MNSFICFLKKNIFIMSVCFCFVFPPIGLFLLFLIGFYSLYKSFMKQKLFIYTKSSFFFLSLLFSSVVASIELKKGYNFLDILMIIGYWGLYLNFSTNDTFNTFKQYRWVMIFGGIYGCFVGWLSKILSVSSSLGFMTGTLLFGESTPNPYNRLIGNAYNPNFMMYLLLISFAFLLAEVLFTIRNKRILSFIWQIPAFIILAKGIFDTGSRSAFVIMIVLFLFFLVRLSKWSFVAIFVLVSSQINHLFDFMPRNESVPHSMNVREDIWIYGFKVWKHHLLFGTTPLGFKNEFSKVVQLQFTNVPHALTNVPHSHDMYLGMFAEFGILGGVAFLILLMANIYKYIPFFLKEKSVYAEHFIFSLPVMVLTGILDEPIFSPQIAILTVLLFAYWEQLSKPFSCSNHFSFTRHFITKKDISV